MREIFFRIGSHLVGELLTDPAFILAMTLSLAAIGTLIHIAVQSSTWNQVTTVPKVKRATDLPSDSYPDLDVSRD